MLNRKGTWTRLGHGRIVFHEANQTMPANSVFGGVTREVEIDLKSMDVFQVLVLSLLPPVLLSLPFMKCLKHARNIHFPYMVLCNHLKTTLALTATTLISSRRILETHRNWV